jgi:hypothetical protein
LTITGSVQQHGALIETKQEEGEEILIKCAKTDKCSEQWETNQGNGGGGSARARCWAEMLRKQIPPTMKKKGAAHSLHDTTSHWLPWNFIPKIGCHYFWRGLILALPNDSLPIDYLYRWEEEDSGQNIGD